MNKQERSQRALNALAIAALSLYEDPSGDWQKRDTSPAFLDALILAAPCLTLEAKARLDVLFREDLCPEHMACPTCGERLMEKLVWSKDESNITCATCGVTYAVDSSPALRLDGPGHYAVYTNPDGTACASCPGCGYDLTAEHGIRLYFLIEGSSVWANSRLAEGLAIDTEDQMIAFGFHTGTACAHCHKLLIDLGIKETLGRRT